MKKILFILSFLLIVVTSHAQHTRSEVYTKIDGLVLNVPYMKSLLDSLTVSVPFFRESYNNPSFINSLSWSKITGTPTTLSGYGITNGVDITTNQTIAGIKTFSSSPSIPTPSSSGDAANKSYVDGLILTISTGLTKTGVTLTSDLSTGKTGGQSVIGGTAASNNLRLSSTSNSTKGSILFGNSSYSEFNDTFSYSLNAPGSTITSTWTATGSNQTSISETGTITGRASVISDSYTGRIFDYTFVAGASSTNPIYNGIVIKGTYPANAGAVNALLVNPNISGSGAGSLLVDFQAAGSSKFKINYGGDVTTSGTTLSASYSTSALFASPLLGVQSSGPNVDFRVYNTAGAGFPMRFRTTNAGVFSLNDGTNDVYTYSPTAFTSWKTATGFPVVQKTGAYSISNDYTIEVTSGTHSQTLPTAVGISGRIYTLTNSGSGTVTMATTSSQTFANVSGTPTSLTIPQFTSIHVQSNGANWIVLSRSNTTLVSGTPGGAQSNVQYNFGGAFKGISNFSFHQSDKSLTISDNLADSVIVGFRSGQEGISMVGPQTTTYGFGNISTIAGTSPGDLSINPAATGQLTLNNGTSSGVKIEGTSTNDAAASGYIGEEINSYVSTYANYTTTATYQNITSITLSAGDWDLDAFFTYSSNSATITAAANAIFAISTTTASASGAVEGKNISYVPQAALLGTSKFSDAIPAYRVSISGSTTYYLNTQATFTIGNPQYVGGIRARRIR